MAQVEQNFKIIFFLFNILFFCMGAGMLAVGIYNIASLLGFDIFARSVYLTGGALFVMVGAVKMILALLGMIGLFLENRILLTIYTLASLFVILPTLAAGIFGLQQWFFVYDEVGTTLTNTYRSDAEFERTQTLRDQFRVDFHCCGIMSGSQDYINNGRAVEDESCMNATRYRTVENIDIPRGIGCQYYISDAIRDHLYYIGTIGLAFGFFEITAAIYAMHNAEGL
ncbi:PREDICTED: tetraspanin-11-like [Amphimedon queenslandica]|uniref:Tetraspanin n=1 Tax=Amphimedon queenslandica TaxID=400682 RepID=A0A1X7U9U9_AMPQE|nr:PREDICTED: tetraspanin-11-like [Amphimedon queenslandica]|eukprot:XP_003388645.1 PREDICTED: tetraspanin-11-like [Amphimedon queenslandica]